MMNTPFTTTQTTATISNETISPPLPPSDPPPPQTINQMAPVFGRVTSPQTFEELAKKADNVMASTLQQYGPAITMTSPTIHSGAPIQCHGPPTFIRQQPISPLPIYPVRPIPTTGSVIIRPSTSSALVPTNRSAATNDFTIPTTPNTVIHGAPMSPPLDALNQNNSVQNRTNDNGDNTEVTEDSERSQRQNPITDINERLKPMGLNDLVLEYRDFERQLESARKRRAELEREIADIMRKAPGQNLELNPNFIKKKQGLSSQDASCRELHNVLKIISEQLEKRFDYTVTQTNQVSQPLQKRARAKMSTAAPSLPKVEYDKHGDKKVMLDLRTDVNLWCKECDIHYSNLKEYCDHLHKRDHLQRANKPMQPPWRTSLELVSRRRSYDQYKSICARLANKLKAPFTVQNLDEALNPSQKDTDTLKEMKLNRERGILSNDDPLFSIKGYDLLIPITGYFCKLCNRALCDFQEAEQHLKSYLHNAEHAKSVALNPAHEKNFRTNLEKSYKKQSVPRKERTSKPSSLARSSASKDEEPPKVTKSVGGQSQWSARLPYKKPTSHIVDDHETIADKFDKRNKEARVLPTKLKRKEIPEIVPISSNQPSAALKRLRNDKKQDDATREEDNLASLIRRLESSDSSDTDDIGADCANNMADLTGEIHLFPGDPNSPFPDLDLVVTGNVHIRVLKDKRLASPAVVKMNRIDLNDYKDMLFEGSSLWARVDQMVTKKEPGEYDKDLDPITRAEPTYYQMNGESVPIELDKSSDEEGEFDIKMLENFFCDK